MWYCFLGPSGAGKSSVAKILGLPEIVSTTTREMRDGEEDGVHYHFTTRQKFCELDMAERAEYSGNWYGLQTKHLEEADNGQPHSIVLEKQGILQIRKLYPGMLKVIYITGTAEQLVRNMRRRGDNDKEIINRLITIIDTNELANADLADLIVVGDTVDDLVRPIRKFIQDTESSL